MSPWPVEPLGEVASTALGKMLDRGKQKGLPSVAYLRNVNVQWGRIDTADLLTMELADNERARFGVEPGDLLVCEGGEVGRCAIWNGSFEYVAYQKALHRIRPTDRLDTKYLRYLLEHHSLSGTLARLATGSTIAHLPQQQLRRVPVPLPEIDQQRRIVTILEDHLSRLDAAATGLNSASRRLAAIRERMIADAVTGGSSGKLRNGAPLRSAGTHDGDLPGLPPGWDWARLGDVADVVGGVTKDAKKQGDPTFVEVPYLRVANVQRGNLKLDEVTTIRVSPGKAIQLALRRGDVLLNEGGDRDKLARGWVWEGQIENCIHQNHVFRARVHEPRLDPYFLSWTANTLGARWAERNGKQSVNLASISLNMIRKMPIIVPPAGAASRIVSDLHDRLGSLDRLDVAITSADRRLFTLRRSLLTAAFSGRLTGSGTQSDVEEMVAI